ncbi:MAG: MarR family winged helix-turn-helix transcriptional regulator [Granulosicoccus sp.]
MNIKNTQFVFALLSAANGIEGRLNRVLSNVKGVSFTEYYLLEQLKDLHNGAATRVDLARAVNLTPSAVTRALKPLEKIGYVTTQKGERDARQSLATLTPAGEELLRDANNLVLDEIASMSIPKNIRAELIQALLNITPKHS